MNKKIILMIILFLLLSLSLVEAKGVYQNYEEIEDIQKGETVTPFGVLVKSFVSGFKGVLSNIFSLDKISIPVNNDTFLKQTLNSKGTVIHYAFKQGMTREINLDGKKAYLKLINPLTANGTIFEFNGKTLKLSSGATAYEDGFLLMRKGNRKVNGTLESIIEIMYVGKDDKDCSHIQCFEGNLHWFYCDGKDYGIIQECGLCVENECTSKDYLSRTVEQDPQIEYENRIKEKIKKGEKVDCIHVNGTEIGTECLD